MTGLSQRRDIPEAMTRSVNMFMGSGKTDSRKQRRNSYGFQDLQKSILGKQIFMRKISADAENILSFHFSLSNDGYAQVFGGETPECVCGLQDIFEYIGGVPEELVFDNATGVGRKIHDKVMETELFSRFRAHYGFRIRFCNPKSGWEKGNVKTK